MRNTLLTLTAFAFMALSSHTCSRDGDDDARPRRYCPGPNTTTLEGDYEGTASIETMNRPGINVTANFHSGRFAVQPKDGESFDMKIHNGPYSVENNVAKFDIGFVTQDWSTAFALHGVYQVGWEGDTLYFAANRKAALAYPTFTVCGPSAIRTALLLLMVTRHG